MDFKSILTRLLARSRDDRYADCHTLHLDLERFLRQTSGDSTTGFVLSRWVAQLAPPGPPTTSSSPSGIRPAEPAAFTASAFAPTGPILLDQQVTDPLASPVPMELDRTVRRPTREQAPAGGFVFPTALGDERSTVEPVTLGIKRTSTQDAIRTDVRRPIRRPSSGGGFVVRLFLIALLAVVGAGLGLWAAGRTDLLTSIGLPIPGASVEKVPATTAAGRRAPPLPRPGLPSQRHAGRHPASPTVAPTASPAVPAAPSQTASADPGSGLGQRATPQPAGGASSPPTASPDTAPADPLPAPPFRPAPDAAEQPAARRDRAGRRHREQGPPRTRTARSCSGPSPRPRPPPTRRRRSGWRARPSSGCVSGDKVLGTTPLTVSLPPPGGSVEIELFDPAMGLSKTEQLDLKQGDNGVHKVVIAKGTLELKIQDGVAVTIDGKSTGTAPLDPMSLYEGRHQVQLSKGELKERRMLEIQGGKTEVLEFTFPEAE